MVVKRAANQCPADNRVRGNKLIDKAVTCKAAAGAAVVAAAAVITLLIVAAAAVVTGIAVAAAEITVVAAVPPQVDRIVLGAGTCQAVAVPVVEALVRLVVDRAVVTAVPVHAVAAAAAGPVWADRVAVVAVAGDKNHDWRNHI
jgi:hypothetical protein